jgi:hypothetical protein
MEPALRPLDKAHVDEQPIICAFTVDELECLAHWGDRAAREIDLGPVERELLERIKRLAVAAREQKPQSRSFWRDGSRGPPNR